MSIEAIGDLLRDMGRAGEFQRVSDLVPAHFTSAEVCVILRGSPAVDDLYARIVIPTAAALPPEKESG